ncbi:MAG: basic amino acid/polyamine antiporter, family [Thermosediminibacterales bacterium]|jgi:amino acid transporter|nr:basic amino acid/polyamine antiporter, family [Thermosediminibacterales bacterium]
MERNTLAKEMSYKDFFFLAFGIYAGVAWVVTLGLWLQHGPLSSFLGFFLCGLILIPVGMAYGELTPAIPVAGGELAYAYKAFGPFAATITGWFLGLAYIIVCPFEAIAVSTVISYMIPSINIIPLYTVKGFTIYLPSMIIGILLTLLFTWMNYVGIKPSKVFQTVCSAIVLILVVLFFIASLFKGSTQNLQPLFAEPGTKGALSGILSVLAVAPFFLAGFDAIPQASEEAEKNLNPKALGQVIIVAIIVGILFYVITTAAATLVAPWQEVIKDPLPTAYAFEVAFGKGMRNIILFGALLGLLTTWNGCFIAGTRVIFALGRGRLIPKIFGEVHEKYKTPHNAVLFGGLITLIGPFVGKAGLIPAVDVGALAFIVAWLSVSLSVIKLRKTAPELNRPYKMPGGTTMGIIAVVVCIILLGLILIPGMPAALVWPTEWIVLGIWIILGLAFYYIVTVKEQHSITKEEQDYYILGEYR